MAGRETYFNVTELSKGIEPTAHFLIEQVLQGNRSVNLWRRWHVPIILSVILEHATGRSETLEDRLPQLIGCALVADLWAGELPVPRAVCRSECTGIVIALYEVY